MTPDEMKEHNRRLRMLGRFVLRLLIEEKDWNEAVVQRIEDAALDHQLMEMDDKGNYKLTNPRL
jgi:hypothetical protein